jgi:phosphatidylserine/phosphatidylglycerophosphate/cardiolipin synthase-like enzyme
MSPSAVTGNREYLLVDTDGADVAEAEAVFNADWARTMPAVSRLVVAPVTARTHLHQLIDSATQEIDIEWEELSDNDIGFHLQSRARANVTVKIVCPSDVATSSPATVSLLKSLAASGVQTRTLGNPSVHAKVILVDHNRGFIGSENATMTSLNNNRELGVLWQNASVAGTVASTFNTDWSNASPL